MSFLAPDFLDFYKLISYWFPNLIYIHTESNKYGALKKYKESDYFMYHFDA